MKKMTPLEAEYTMFSAWLNLHSIILKGNLEKHYERIVKKKLDSKANEQAKKDKKNKYKFREVEQGRAIAFYIHLLGTIKKDESLLSKFNKYHASLFVENLLENNLNIVNFNLTQKKNAAAKRWKADPKTDAKNFVKECWNAWQKNKSLYKSKSSFALDMLGKFEDVLTSPRVIEDWCRKWEKESVS
jgi:hypothetical protein